jgi:serine/threonine protein kinase
MKPQGEAAPLQALNEYVVKEQIAAGGMGTVFRAFDVQLKRHVALKVLKNLDYDSLERFVREREITADLDHPNFVRILSTGYISTAEGRRPFYTMPLLRGETLAEMVRRRCAPDENGEILRQEFTLPRLLQLVQQLCLALESAHDRGIIHRDLKPANIILGTYGELYIVDLGLAKYIKDAEGTAEADAENGERETFDPSSDLTAQAPAGTPFFMAPEQLLDPLRVDARTDIFGLGAILYYILSGQRPLYRPATVAQPVIRIPDPAVRAQANAAPAARRPDPFLETAKFPHWHEDSEEVRSSSSSTAFLYHALHGILVPPDELAAQARAAIEGGRGDGPVLDSVDPALNAICLKALARAPEQRFSTCREMWQEIQQYLEGRLEMILKREATDLTRSMTRRTIPTALRDYELAEERLRERIAQKESVGRVGIEETLDLFDLLLEKAKIFKRRGESASIIRSVTRAEPIIESALEVLQRQFIQLLVVKGAAQAEQKDFAGAKTILAKAIALSRTHRQDDLLASASCGYGVACSGTGDPADLDKGRSALEDSITQADLAGDAAQGIRSRVSLARFHREARRDPKAAIPLLEKAIKIAGQDHAHLCEVLLELASCHLARKEPSMAVRHAEDAIRYAEEQDAQNLAREGHFLMGQACHALGQGVRRTEHFRLALKVRGPRRTFMEQEIAAFYARHRLDPGEIGLRVSSEPARRPASPSPSPQST